MSRTGASTYFSPSSSMNAITHVAAALLILTSTARGLIVFDNHRYGGGAETSHLKGYSGLQNQILKERTDFLMKFIGELQPTPTVSTDDYKPKDHIAPNDVVGVIPPDMFKKPVKRPILKRKTPPPEAPAPSNAKPADSDTVTGSRGVKVKRQLYNEDASTPGESQVVQNYKDMWSDTEFTPERIRNHRYAPAHKSYGLYEKPYGRVRVHTYRGPQKEYWVVPEHHKPQQKTYSPWGYYVKQPVGSEQHKFHSPLDLTYNFD